MVRSNSHSALQGINRRTMCCVLASGLVTRAWAGEDRPEDDKAGSARQRERMQRRAGSLRLTQGEKPSELIETAILRYSNPGGITVTTDGAVWAWGKTGRPAALSAIFYEQLPKGEEKWSCELTSLSDEPLVMTAPSGWTWSPAKSDLKWQPISDAPAVGDTATKRLRQMKELARLFTAAEKSLLENEELRLLVQPLHRYADPPNEILDGGLFAFAAGTNPEVLLLLEARGEEAKSGWHLAFARMGAADSQAHRNKTLVWEVPGIKAWRNKEAYYSVFGKDQIVFGQVDDD